MINIGLSVFFGTEWLWYQTGQEPLPTPLLFQRAYLVNNLIDYWWQFYLSNQFNSFQQSKTQPGRCFQIVGFFFISKQSMLYFQQQSLIICYEMQKVALVCIYFVGKLQIFMDNNSQRSSFSLVLGLLPNSIIGFSSTLFQPYIEPMLRLFGYWFFCSCRHLSKPFRLSELMFYNKVIYIK